MNRIDELFKIRKENILSIYFTAGYPDLNSTVQVIEKLASAGVDLVEIGVPFSDPMADGPAIQHSNSIALKNGMNLKLLFRQLRNIRKSTNIPLIIMSYINPLLRFGIENFCNSCMETGIDGIILPDLPLDMCWERYLKLFNTHGLSNILMISPRTSNKRIRKIDRLSRGFIYMVSSSSTTGIKKGFTKEQLIYFSGVKEMNLRNPLLIGFGISDPETFRKACDLASGAIIGSAFVRLLGEKGTGNHTIENFISQFRPLALSGI